MVAAFYNCGIRLLYMVERKLEQVITSLTGESQCHRYGTECLQFAVIVLKLKLSYLHPILNCLFKQNDRNLLVPGPWSQLRYQLLCQVQYTTYNGALSM